MKYLPAAVQGRFPTECRQVVTASSPVLPSSSSSSSSSLASLMLFKSRNGARARRYSQMSDVSHTTAVLRLGAGGKCLNSLQSSLPPKIEALSVSLVCQSNEWEHQLTPVFCPSLTSEKQACDLRMSTNEYL